MIIYSGEMRKRDGEKQAALFEATVKLVNDIGFVASSVSKIAKEAGVSPATIYVYYDNKEALLVSTYIEIKRHLSLAIFRDFDDRLPIRDILRNVWLSMFDYISSHPDYFTYIEQFANSPYNALVDKDALEKPFIPLINVLQRGIDRKIIKNVGHHLLGAFMFHPITHLANPRMYGDLQLDDNEIEAAFNMAWDAIKL